MEELKEELVENEIFENDEPIEVINNVEEKNLPIDTEDTVIKDFFIKETGITLKEMAVLFGQTEEEISKEYGAFKAKKLYAKLDYILTSDNYSYEDFKAKCSIIADYGFKSITVLPTYIGISKDFLKGKKVLVRAFISYPHGEDFSKVKYYAVKQAIKLGADAIAVVLSSRRIKNGNYKVIVKNLKKIIKIAKHRPVTAVINSEVLSSYELDKICKILSKDCKLYSVMPYFFSKEKGRYESTIKEVVASVNGKCHVDFGGEIDNVLDTVNLFNAGANSITNIKNLDVANELNIKIMSNV